MPRTESKTVPEGNGLFAYHDYKSGGLTTEEIYRVFAEKLDKCFDRKTSHFDQRFEDMEEEQEYTAPSRTAASGSAATSHRGGRYKTRHKALRAYGAYCSRWKYGDTSSARVENDQTNLARFGNIAKPLAPEKYIVKLWSTKAKAASPSRRSGHAIIRRRKLTAR